MKADNYPTLCIEQAAKSPLRYLHGSIIVRGGKVIGQGYNDYRAGFSGGVLKTGRLPVSIMDNTAISEMKKKHKLKREGRDEQEPESNVRTTKMFTPFENMNGDKHVNTPFSMHSEMVAIHSAISASNTLASTFLSCEKPCFKVPGGTKRKARRQREAIKAYVEIICSVAIAQSTAEQRCGSTQVQQWRFEAATPESGQTGYRVSIQREGRGRDIY